MRTKKLALTVAAVLIGGLAVIIGLKFAEKGMPKSIFQMEEKKPDGFEAASKNVPSEIAKLDALQAEIAKLSDETIDKEIENIKQKVQASGLVNSSDPSFDINAHPETKDLLMRMALLRVEKSKRMRKSGAEQP